MLKRLPLPFNFLVIFLVSAGIFFVLWHFVFIVYLYALTIFAKPLWMALRYQVQPIMQGGVLHFVYHGLGNEPISFSVEKADEIFLNLILVLALFSATRVIAKESIGKALLYSTGILFLIHEFILFAYSYTHVWDFIETQNAETQTALKPIILQMFPKTLSGFFGTVLYHWNAWGWDVVPLILWLGTMHKTVQRWLSGTADKRG